MDTRAWAAGVSTVLVGVGYFSVWILAGVLVFPLGAALAAVVRAMPGLVDAVPFVVGALVLAAGVLQFTRWKARQLACCRGASTCDQEPAVDTRTAWRHGARLGLHCVRCCAGLTVMLLAIGMMDLRAMAVVTLAITLERLLPAGERVARAIGVVTVVVGVVMLVRAAGVV